jgi:hypothetical protein
MQCVPFLPGEQVYFQRKYNASPLKGTVHYVFGNGLVSIILETKVIIQVSPRFLSHIHSFRF